jgi:hypothetical protein
MAQKTRMTTAWVSARSRDERRVARKSPARHHKTHEERHAALRGKARWASR